MLQVRSGRTGPKRRSPSPVDAATGRLKWHYQFTPHDELDYDSTQVPVLADLDWQVPDVIALPGGNLGNTAAFGKALSEAYEVGLIDRLRDKLTGRHTG